MEQQAVEIICVECGETIRVADPAEVIRALHLVNECSLASLLMRGPQE